MKKVRKEFQCNQCEFSAKHPSNLQIHSRVHSDEKPFSCDVPGCKYKTRWERSLKHHSTLFHEDDKTVWYECDKCDFRTKYDYVLKQRHSKLHAELPTPKKFKCELCDYGTDVKYRLENHTRTHTGEKKPIFCEIPGCDFFANWKSSVYKHMQRVHWERIWHKCDQCPFKTWHRAGLTAHMKIHSEEKTFKCVFDDCNYRSNTKSALYGHLTRHEYDSVELISLVGAADGKKPNSEMVIKIARNLKRFPCEHPGCDYVAKHRRHLSTHQQTYDPHRTRSFKCLLCSKLFFTEASRSAHLKTHTSEKSFNCIHPGCHHRAYTLSELRKHEHIHQIAKPFICDFPGCNYSATYKGYLIRHAKTHKTERKPEFQCNFCPRSFYYRGGLRRHIFSHTNEKPFKCSTCGYTSVLASVFNKHRCPDNLKTIGRVSLVVWQR